MRASVGTILLAGVLLGTPVVRAQTAPAMPAAKLNPAAELVVKLVDDHYNSLKSLQTQYIEHYTGMGMDKTETGTLLLKKPGKMRWNYDQPAGKVFILDGKFGWFYTPGDAQAQKISAKQLDDLRSPLRLLLGHTKLKSELDGLDVSEDLGVFRITGVPKGMGQRVKLLTLDTTATGAITKMRLEEVDGSATEFTFSGMKENAPVSEGEFNFTPPAGVSIVEGQPPI